MGEERMSMGELSGTESRFDNSIFSLPRYFSSPFFSLTFFELMLSTIR